MEGMDKFNKIDNIENIPKEIWITLISDKYRISNFSRIKIYSKYSPAILSNPSTDNNGYKLVGLFINGKNQFHRVHRLVAKYFIPNPNNMPIINHINGIKSDNRIENLEWCTYKHNSNSARIRKPGVFGQGHPFAKISNKMAIKIFNSKLSGVSLSKKYGLTVNTISQIKTGKRWSHVTNKKYSPRKFHWIEFNNRKMLLADWARLFSISHASLLRKIKSTTSFEDVYNYYKNKNGILCSD